MKPRIQKLSRICQGDIYRNVEYIEYIVEKSGIIEVSKIVFPYAVVLTQDCDLLQDFKARYQTQDHNTQDKFLLSVLVAPLYNAEHVFNGEHLSQLDIKMQVISKKNTQGKYLQTNQLSRYHYVEFSANIDIVPSVIDFKHYFSVNIMYLKNEKKKDFVCRIPPLYRENLSQRYAAFLSRVGLP